MNKYKEDVSTVLLEDSARRMCHQLNNTPSSKGKGLFQVFSSEQDCIIGSNKKTQKDTRLCCKKERLENEK